MIVFNWFFWGSRAFFREVLLFFGLCIPIASISENADHICRKILILKMSCSCLTSITSKEIYARSNCRSGRCWLSLS